MRGLNIPPTSYLLRDAPSEAMLRAVPCEAMLRPERRVVPGRAVHCPLSIVHCPFLLRFSTQASLRAERSIVLCPFSFFPLTLQSYNTGEAKSRIWPRQRRAARVSLLACRRSALIVNRLVANGLSSFALAPLALSPLPCPLLLQCVLY